MYWTRFLIPTSKETPADATARSHQLMLRAGIIRQVMAGVYSYLPLGWRSLQKIVDIIREEMNRAGAVELHLPVLQPLEWWQQTGRDQSMGDTLIRLPDQPWRRGTVLGPTHEEVITEIARAYLTSYKQLPINLYQIQTKFRDEQRPKSGVLRTREFLMKDAYSFDIDKAGLDASYQRMYDAYCRIFTRCGLPYTAVEADSGVIGGDASHEFMVVTEAGEDVMVRTADGSYAANVERAAVAPLPEPAARGTDAVAEIHTPGLTTIDQVSGFLKCSPNQMIKTIIYEADGEALIALVRGDHEVNEAKLRRAAGATSLTLAGADRIRELTGAEIGFAGPMGLEARMITDQAVAVMPSATSGANKTDYHLTGVVPGRDFDPGETADIRYAVPGDRAANGQELLFEKCIEVGHVFKLGTKYSQSMNATVLDADGVAQPLVMGCYGIGANRIMAAAIESSHDEGGICWPMSIAPFQVEIVALDVRDEAVMSQARRLHDELESEGYEVLLDDRDARPGVKFKDADLIGVPLRITVGKRGLAENIVEFKKRTESDVHKIAPDEVVARIREAVGSR